jgi:hypothetical protein
MADITKMAGKLEHRGRDLKEDPTDLGRNNTVDFEDREIVWDRIRAVLRDREGKLFVNLLLLQIEVK